LIDAIEELNSAIEETEGLVNSRAMERKFINTAKARPKGRSIKRHLHKSK
jgi:hypothetical protein